ncbi:MULTISPECIES: DUF2057 family protein [unclassified Moraxella]|uniref:DUF2057 family protein n=1 Tax=unclassified Moraxella TaxID=2685852 RepID=UPI003AF9F3E8
MQNCHKILLATLLTATSLPALAQVTLNLGENVVVTAINGQEVQTGMFSNPQRKFTLEAGKHVITAKYNRLYELRGDNHDMLRSSNISVPVELADNQSYELVMANQPNDYTSAKEYAKKPTLAVVQNGKTLASQQSTSVGGSSLFIGLGTALGGVFGGGNKAIESNQQTINALEGKPANTIPAIQATQPAVASASSDTLDQFMNLWLKATPAERDKIRQWVQK